MGEVNLEMSDADLAPSSGLYSSDWATDSDEDFWDSESESELGLGFTGFLLAAALVFGGILLFYKNCTIATKKIINSAVKPNA